MAGVRRSSPNRLLTIAQLRGKAQKSWARPHSTAPKRPKLAQRCLILDRYKTKPRINSSCSFSAEKHHSEEKMFTLYIKQPFLQLL